MHKYRSKMTSQLSTTSTEAPETQHQKAHSILFKNKPKVSVQRTVEQEWFRYISEETDFHIDPLVYWQVSEYLANTNFSLICFYFS